MVSKTTDPSKSGNVVAGASFATPQDGTILARIGRASVGRASIHIGDLVLSHGTAFVYKQVLDSKSKTSTLYLLTNLHVVKGILYLYPYFLDTFRQSQKLTDDVTGIRVRLGEHSYSIPTVLTPRGQFFKDAASETGNLDFALFKLSLSTDEPLEFFAIPTTWDTQQGAPVFALGFPKDMELSITDGIISHIYGDNPKDPIYKWTIQHNLLINPGNSGGPTITPFGHVIGISTSGRTDAIGLNFSLDLQHILEYCKDPANLEEIQIEKVIARLRSRAQEESTYGA